MAGFETISAAAMDSLLQSKEVIHAGEYEGNRFALAKVGIVKHRCEHNVQAFVHSCLQGGRLDCFY